MGAPLGTHKPSAGRGSAPVWALVAAALLCYLWATSSSSSSSNQQQQRSASSVYLPASSLKGDEPGLLWCTPEEAEKQANKFAAALKKEGLYTACPSHKWLGLLPRLLEAGQDVVVLDVGCNKGYESAAFFATYAPQAGVSPRAVYEALSAVKDDLKLGPIEGQCKDNESGGGGGGDGSGSSSGGAGSVTVHCFEPSARNYRGLQALHAKFFGGDDGGKGRGSSGSSNEGGTSSGDDDGGPRVEWRQYNAAVTNVTGKVRFPSECNTELCSLGGDAGDPSQKSAWTDVRATTLDDFAAGGDGGGLLAPAASAAAREGRRRFVVLKIDTEGFDPAVLQGARRLLAARVPAIVSFEHHGKGVSF